MSTYYLVVQLESELHNAGGLGAGDRAESRLAEGCPRGAGEIHLVEGVEQLPAELQAEALFHGHVLQNRKIPGVIVRPAIIGEKAAHIAESIGRRIDKGRGIEPAVDTVLFAARRLALEAGRIRPLAAAVGSG